MHYPDAPSQMSMHGLPGHPECLYTSYGLPDQLPDHPRRARGGADGFTGGCRVTQCGFGERRALAHFAAGPRSQELRCVAAVIVCVVSCSDFRVASHVCHSRTERALQLASQHVVAGAAVLVLPELSSSHAPHGAIVCG